VWVREQDSKFGSLFFDRSRGQFFRDNRRTRMDCDAILTRLTSAPLLSRIRIEKLGVKVSTLKLFSVIEHSSIAVTNFCAINH
jgi:hypothetical protein